MDEARDGGNDLGYPVMLKASAGGGGKGMRRVDRESELEAALRDASSEAGRAFRDSEVYLEKLVEEPRHIEIQVLGDHHGHLIHLGERECTIQRRHQKVIEECPSPLMATHPDLREQMGEAAVRVARAAGYATRDGRVSGGSRREFLFPGNEHAPAGGASGDGTGDRARSGGVAAEDRGRRAADIAAERCYLARFGDRVPDLRRGSGSAIFCRRPGLIEHLSEPSGPGIRLDSGVFEGWTVPLEYDPLLAKLAAWGPVGRRRSRLDGRSSEYVLTGVRNNIAFFREVLAEQEFRGGRFDLFSGRIF